jgi:flagellar M-ring protein FliF
MDNAISPVPPQALVPADNGFATRLAALPARSKLMLAVGVAALVALALSVALVGNSGDYKVLYANLSDKDGGAIVQQLSQMNVPYKYTEGGTAILVPASQVHDVRLKLASAGLPKGGTVGFELMDNARFGQTQFQERLTFQRGLEGELVRSITSLAAVAAARVHLALPNQNGFFREQQKASASVVLTLHPGRTLDRAQIAGIVHLVSSSVPEMSPKAVSVIDQTGALLSSPEGAAANGLDAQQLQYVSQIEGAYGKRINDILEPVLGRDNLRATVTAEVDFSQSEATSEEFKPNQGNEPATVRSQQVSESSNGHGATPSGVPGATSNQPPVPATAPINGPAQALQAASNGGAANNNTRRENVTNYEVDKTVRVTRNATGTVKRLNAAVVVNHHVSTDAKGRTTSTPLSGPEIEQLTALVQQAIGFSKERGDSVRVINAPFRVEAAPKAEDVPLWQRPALQDLLRSLAMPFALVLVGLAVVFGMIRPALKAVLPAAPVKGTQLDAVVDDAMPLPVPPALDAPRNNVRLDQARVLAKDNPAAVANIVRGWVSGDVS